MRTASIKAILRLDNSQFMRGVRQSFAAAALLGRHFARRPFQTTGALGLQALRQGIKATATGISALGKATAMFGGVARTAFLGGSIAGVAYAAIITKITHDSIAAASTLESLTVTFSVLLKSAEAGKQRMAQLLTFANDKGLRLTVVAEASKNLQTLTMGALATGKGLEFVGDVASGARREFGAMAVTLGRVYDAMRSGTAAGEELRSLQDAGALSGGARRYIEGLSKIGLGALAWKELQKEMSKFSGMMNQQSGTWERRMEKFKDSIEEAQRQFGTPLINALKPTLSALTNLIFHHADGFSKAGEKFAETVKASIEFLVGAFSDPSTIAAPLSAGLKAAFASSANYMVAAFRSGLHIVFSEDFFNAIGKSFWGLSKVIGGHLTDSFKDAIAYFVNGLLDGWELVKATMDGKNPLNPIVDAVYAVQRKSIELGEEDIAKRKPGSGATSWLGEKLGRHGDIEMTQEEHAAKRASVDATKADLARALAEREAALKKQKEERKLHIDNVTTADIAEAAKQSIEDGKKLMKEGGDSFFNALKKAAKDFKVTDIYGAADAWKEIPAKLKKAQDKGKEVIKATEPVIESEKDKAKRLKKEAAEQRKFEWDSLSYNRLYSPTLVPKPTWKANKHVEGGRFTDSLKDLQELRKPAFKALFDRKPIDFTGEKAKRETPWLKRRERIAMDNEKVAAIMAINGGKNPRDNQKVRRGDRKRMQEAMREKMREKAGVDKTNEILTTIQVVFDKLVAQ